MVFLRISPWKGVVRFGKRGKLSPRYIGPSSSVGNESASHCNKSPFEHGFELSRRRKKRPVGTWRNSTYEWAPT